MNYIIYKTKPAPKILQYDTLYVLNDRLYLFQHCVGRVSIVCVHINIALV